MIDLETLKQSVPAVGVVVNYYCKDPEAPNRQVLIDCTRLGLRFLSLSRDVSSIVLVDGSATADIQLESLCREMSIQYIHSGGEINYVEAYNLGWRALSEDIIALMANDIVPFPTDTIGTLRDFLIKPGVGCVFPYMSSSRTLADEVQGTGFISRSRIDCEPTSMTLNLVMFKRQVLEEIDGLDENFVFGFQEPILLIKIRSMGWRMVQVGNTGIFHFEQLTKVLGASSLTHENYLADQSRWYAEYPEYSSKTGAATIRLSKSPFSRFLSIKLLWRLVETLKGDRIRDSISRYVTWLEPWLTRYSEKPKYQDRKCMERDRVAMQIERRRT